MSLQLSETNCIQPDAVEINGHWYLSCTDSECCKIQEGELFHSAETKALKILYEMGESERLKVSVLANEAMTKTHTIIQRASNKILKRLSVLDKLANKPEGAILKYGTSLSDKKKTGIFTPISELTISTRAATILLNENISFLGELCQKTESDVLKFRNSGKKTKEELTLLLKIRGMHFGQDLTDEEKEVIRDLKSSMQKTEEV